MIPPQIASEADAPPGEVDLFRWFERDSGTRGWIVLHALDVAAHRKRLAGEMDFVVIVPHKGVLCLEVKSHEHIRCTDGEWYYGHDRHPGRNPFRQAEETMHSLRDDLAKHHRELQHVLFWRACVFPYVHIEATSVEWHDWELIDVPKLESKPIGAICLDVLEHARELAGKTRSTRSWFDPSSPSPTSAECELIAETLRPNFEYFVSPRARARHREEEIRFYTTRQMRALDAMRANPRVLFTGPSGTGKTFMAIEAARRSREAGRRTLLLCRNRLLGTWLGEQVEDLGPEVTTSTLVDYLALLSGYAMRGDEPPEFRLRDLPAMALRTLRHEGSAPQSPPFDALIVDEAQDLITPEILDVFDAILDGGLRNGRWLMFGDLSDQGLSASASPAEALLQQRTGGHPIYRLTENCRNAPAIAAFVARLSGIPTDSIETMRPAHGDEAPPEVIYYDDPDEQGELLVTVFEKLFGERYRSGDIVVLSLRSYPESAVARVVSEPWKSRLAPYEPGDVQHVRYAAARDFTGLESQVVVITDVDHIEKDLAIAAARAQDRLVVLADRRLENDFR